MSKNLIDTVAQNVSSETPAAIRSPKYSFNCCQGNTSHVLSQNAPQNRGSKAHYHLKTHALKGVLKTELFLTR